MPQRERDIVLAVSLDVEEEGLFGGAYQLQGATVRNVAELKRFAPLCERGIKPTLFCAHSVLADADACRCLARMRDTHGAEIGAHLHHWNTPPVATDHGAHHADGAVASRVPAGAVPNDLMADKLHSLFDAARNFQGAAVTSFRMGRWDLHRQHWPLLAQAGVQVDASVRPLHGASASGNPDHFDAPSNPYWVPVGDTKIFEAPLTATPLLPCLRSLASGPAKGLRGAFHTWGALALLPVYHPLWAMKRITDLYIRRGGRLLSLTWHSSEMMPGGAPHIPDEAAVRALLGKITAYVDWLERRWNIRHCTMQQVREALGPDAPTPQGAPGCDWTTAGKGGEA